MLFVSMCKYIAVVAVLLLTKLVLFQLFCVLFQSSPVATAAVFNRESNQALPKPAIPPQRNDYPLQRREDVPEFNPLTFFEHISEILPATRISESLWKLSFLCSVAW